MEDQVNPSHYQMPGGVQVWDVTRYLTPVGFNICKYTMRATQIDTKNNKGQTAAERLVDLKKARWYLDEAIEEAEAEAEADIPMF